MLAAPLALVGWQFLELEQREKAPRFFWAFSVVLRAKDTSRHPPEVICGTVFENVRGVAGSAPAHCATSGHFADPPPARRAAASRFAGTPLLIVPSRDASRACHSDASCNATEHALFIVPYQGFSWCYVQVVVPMWH